MKAQPILYAITAGIGIMLGMLINRPDSGASGTQTVVNTEPQTQTAARTENSQPPTGIQAQIDQLKLALEQERKQRQSLETRLTALADQVSALQDDATLDTQQTEPNRQDKTLKTKARRAPGQVSGWINADLLLAAGMEETEVQRITNLYENVEMEKLYLRDRAEREGWMGSKRFRDEMGKLNGRTDNLRSELSEEAYDAYLFATSKPNRVFVQGTLGNSPAAQAGIKPGDAIIKYDEARIYSWSDLRSATTKGDPSGMVRVTIERDGQRMDVFVPRGPLGVRLDHRSINPAG